MQAIRRVSDIKTILMGILGEQDRNFEVMDAMNSFGAFSKNAEFYCGGMIKAMRAARAKPLDTKVIKLSDVWQKDVIKQIGEGPWAAMMQTKVDGELIFCLADHTIDGRATSFGVDPEHVVKELLMMIDDKPYVFLTTGNQRVSIDQAKQALKATTARLAPSEYVPIFTGLLHTCISPVGHVSMDQTAPLIIMNEEILKLKNNKSTDFVITSAGCTGFFLKLSVDEFVRLVNPINTVKLH
jgi:prolyl-tRNA editing enzyme YbaK/EbsC (Cys-tRNA(Pro) deacylase)